jgi:hypothetical protein
MTPPANATRMIARVVATRSCLGNRFEAFRESYKSCRVPATKNCRIRAEFFLRVPRFRARTDTAHRICMVEQAHFGGWADQVPMNS